MSTLEPDSVPLPPASDDTCSVHSVSGSESVTHSSKRTTRTTQRVTRSSRRNTPFSDASEDEQTHATPVPSSPVKSRTLETIEDVETPRPLRRSGRGGGKYHPGQQREAEIVRARESTPASDAPTSPQPSSGTESDMDAEKHWESERSEAGEEDSEFEDMDRTVAVNFDDLHGFPASARSRRTTGRSSPGRTPAKQLLGQNNDFTCNFTLDFHQMETPRASDFENTNIPPSMFANIQKTPCLVASSPQKLNTIHGYGNIQADAGLEDESWKDAKIKHLEALLSVQSQPSYEDFLEFSPEKKAAEPLEDVQLTVKKRRSPSKNVLSAAPSPIARTPSRTFKTPVKAFVGMFEEISNGKPVVTAEEKKASKRRRQTQELRDFSAIDLNQLKGHVNNTAPPTVTGIVEEEELEKEAEKADEVMADTNQEKEVGQEVAEDTSELEAPQVKAQHVDDPVTAAAPKPEVAPRSPIVIPPTPAPAVRNRVRRSSSCPPVPQPLFETSIPSMRKPTPTTASLMDIDSAISSLHSKIAELEDALETSTVQLEKTTAALHAERRARIAAQETCHFLELERKFGVCCSHAPGAQTREEKLGAAAVGLPASPAGSVASSIYSNRAPSRLTRERPTSRLGPAPARPQTAMGIQSKKRLRDEPPARKPPMARPEKRVLSAGNAAGDSMAQRPIGGLLAKKPEKIAGIGRLAAQQQAARNSALTSGPAKSGVLGRGARR